MGRWFVDRIPRLNSMMLKIDKLLGYPKQKEYKDYWDR
jgi:hypothetical protein